MELLPRGMDEPVDTGGGTGNGSPPSVEFIVQSQIETSPELPPIVQA